jgi:heme/copper-type cytochrome/quinol oxidase subunit 4
MLGLAVVTGVPVWMVMYQAISDWAVIIPLG